MRNERVVTFPMPVWPNVAEDLLAPLEEGDVLEPAGEP